MKAFLMYFDYREYFSYLSNDEKAQLLDALFQYATDKKTPKDLEGPALIVFSVIKNQMDRDSEKYSARCEANRRNGSLGGRPRSVKQTACPSGVGEEKREEEKNPVAKE